MIIHIRDDALQQFTYMLEEADGYVDLLDWNNLLGKSYCIRLTAQKQFKSKCGILLPFLPKNRFRLKVDGHVVKFKVVQRGLKCRILISHPKWTVKRSESGRYSIKCPLRIF